MRVFRSTQRRRGKTEMGACQREIHDSYRWLGGAAMLAHSFGKVSALTRRQFVGTRGAADAGQVGV